MMNLNNAMTNYRTPSYQKANLNAQMLNERGASLISSGNHEAAINTLAQALQYAERCIDDVEYMAPGHGCRCCGLEDCMTYSEHYYHLHTSATSSAEDEQSQYEGYVYKNPIRIVPRATQEGHRMGMALPLIIVFNLALAQHLGAIHQKQITRSHLQKVMHLYELAYRWTLDDNGTSQLASLRFTMVISNNLGEIHRAVNNHTKHEMCLQHLLSTMMFAVDCRHDNDYSLDFEGFLRNASRLILQAHCAGAA